jgi:hypothetical protein
MMVQQAVAPTSSNAGQTLVKHRSHSHAEADGVDEAQPMDALLVQAVDAARHEAAVTAAAAAAAAATQKLCQGASESEKNGGPNCQYLC